MVNSWAGPSAVWLTVTESGSELEDTLESEFELESGFELEFELIVLSLLLSFVCSWAGIGLRDSAVAHEVMAAAVTMRTEKLQARAICLLFILLCPVLF
jgi:hypothetical protein